MKKTINAPKAPAAVGPYVHAVEANGLIFTSGQIGLIPETGELQNGIEAQTHQVFKNLQAVLEAAGSDLDHAVKTSVFIDDINDFAKVNEIYAEYFTGDTPARSCVEVAKLPKGALVEIEVIAVKKEA
ncbi:RidA family protein [Roseburia sp. 499]|uniref:RidA family protein n=1 Tax=Roseburia sp. 499 TaxID=1261634 RepID=UPI00095345E3|nr:RidA family protein [Roseburia sp. 499]WVK68626.1 RidA family protein [Roseburia sp. 499]